MTDGGLGAYQTQSRRAFTHNLPARTSDGYGLGAASLRSGCRSMKRFASSSARRLRVASGL